MLIKIGPKAHHIKLRINGKETFWAIAVNSKKGLRHNYKRAIVNNCLLTDLNDQFQATYGATVLYDDKTMEVIAVVKSPNIPLRVFYNGWTKQGKESPLVYKRNFARLKEYFHEQGYACEGVLKGMVNVSIPRKMSAEKIAHLINAAPIAIPVAF